MRRRGGQWELTFRNEAVTVPDSKGLRDLAILLSRPGVDVHVLELAGSPVDRRASIEMVDRTALAQYRQRLSDLDDDIAEAERNSDTERLARAEVEREALVDELRAVSGLGGRARLTGADAGERARKAVSARIKDADSTPRRADAAARRAPPPSGRHRNLVPLQDRPGRELDRRALRPCRTSGGELLVAHLAARRQFWRPSG